MTENSDAEIVATCEAAVSWLTDDEQGWAQGGYTDSSEVGRGEGRGIDYSGVRACLGGALVLVGLESTVQPGIVGFGVKLAECPALPAVAAVIREKHPTDAHSIVVPPQILAGDPTYRDRQTIFEFNDDADTTVEDVVDVLNETIKRHTPDAYSVTGDGSPDGADTGGAPGA